MKKLSFIILIFFTLNKIKAVEFWCNCKFKKPDVVVEDTDYECSEKIKVYNPDPELHYMGEACNNFCKKLINEKIVPSKELSYITAGFKQFNECIKKEEK